MSVGIAKSQQRKINLPDWEGMLAEEEEQQQTQQSGTTASGGGGTTIYQPVHPQSMDSQEIQEMYQHSGMKYHPIWFSRDQGWNGQTYDAAKSYCASQGKLVICPYDAICPAGPNMMPMGGKKAGADPDGSSWAPFGDVDNAWAQIGIGENWCEALDGAPQWGVNDGEGVTRYVACCRVTTDDDEDTDFGATAANDNNPSIGDPVHVQEEFGSQMYVEKQYNGQWFDRTSGWEGTTYINAMSFCASQGKMVVCPYEGYCPEGENSVPFGGVKVGFDGEQEQWAPIGNKYDEWVQIGPVNMCMMATDIQEDKPAWEYTEEGSQIITQHVMCCPVVGGNGDGGSAPAPTTVVNNEAQQAPAPSAVTSGEAKQAQFDWAAEAYEPLWFDRSNGWLGTNYGEAINFCQQQQGKTICPFEAYCPMTKAPESVPFGGVKSEYSWAPIDDAENWWVQVSGADTCQLYNEMNGGPPSWGMVGKNELETRYVMCCKRPDAGMGDADYYHSSMSDQTETLPKVVIDKDECQDHPTAVITTDGKTCENFIAHVGRVPLHNVRCSHESPVKDENGATLLVKDVCRLSCGECGNVWPNGPAATTSDETVEVVEENDALAEAGAKFKVSRYDRDTGWHGSSYYEALKFCGARGATVCPYEAYCPQGPGKAIVGGMEASSQWVPFINVANGWIQIGPEDTCMPYNSLNPFPPEWGLTGQNNAETSHIMCCETDDNWMPADQIANVVVSSAPSQIDKISMDMFKPIWYGRKHGWQGGTHQDAAKFCNNIGDMEVCPFMAVCPDGETLLNDMSPFPGEQWAPLSDGDWALIGSAGSKVCGQYNTLTGQPSTDVDGMEADKKQHIMCCAKSIEDTDTQNMDEVIKASMAPTWYGKSDGWNGGSHSDAIDYCQKNGGGQNLCPYVGYCPYGEGNQPFPGHPVDFNTERMQWSPWVEGTGKGWVLISQKYQNSATTCMTYRDLEGGTPPWDESGNSNLFAEAKKYILCCNTGEGPQANPQSPILLPTPTNPPTPKPSSLPTPKPTLPPQDVKWYPMDSAGEKECVQGSGYSPYLLSQGWTYETEIDCCNAWSLPCSIKEMMWYPSELNGEQVCVQGNEFSSFMVTSGWLYTTEQQCCIAMSLDCAPVQPKWYPTVVAGEKACTFGVDVPPSPSLQFDSKGECCAAFPLACPTTTTTTTRPAVTAPPCTPMGGKGCHWWPKVVSLDEGIKCIYSSNWPIEAADHLFSDYDSCYCEYFDC
eukprot:scaffold9839_cov157-Skeletonema_marinoi.AAC.6